MNSSNTQSRAGVHSDDKYRVQAYYTSEQKAVMQLVAKLDKTTLTNEILDAVYRRAFAFGIVDENGKVTDAFKDQVEIQKLLVEPCPCGPWEMAPDMGRYFSSVFELDDVTVQGLFRAAKIALHETVRDARARRGDAERCVRLAPARPMVRIDGTYFGARLILRLVSACQMVFDGVVQPRLYIGEDRVVLSCGHLQACVAAMFGVADDCLFAGDVGVDARTFDVFYGLKGE